MEVLRSSCALAQVLLQILHHGRLGRLVFHRHLFCHQIDPCLSWVVGRRRLVLRRALSPGLGPILSPHHLFYLCQNICPRAPAPYNRDL